MTIQLPEYCDKQGARKLLAEALEAEIENFLAQFNDLKDDHGGQIGWIRLLEIWEIILQK